MPEKLSIPIPPSHNRPPVRHELFAVFSFGDETQQNISIRKLFSINESDQADFDPFLEMRMKEHDLLAAEEPVLENLQPIDLHDIPALEEMEETSVANNTTDSLIDSFLADIPVLQRPKPGEKVKEPHPVAFASIEEDDEIVSETLAILNWKQNNKPEAIRIYEKLCLLYPEKSAYFEAQILKIKE